MSDLAEYVLAHVERGQCRCGLCIDGGETQPEGHTVDMVFFELIGVNNPDSDKLTQLIKEHVGSFNEVDLFDGKEHGYIEIGGWIGDQGLALMLMGLGVRLGLWSLLSPKMLGLDSSDELSKKMVGLGYLSIKNEKVSEKAPS